VHGFGGRAIVLKDDRVSATSWAEHAAALGLELSAGDLLLEFAVRGPCVLAIDGADRLLLSQRRGVVTDLLKALAKSDLRDRWVLITTARDFQTRDLVVSALTDAGFENVGQRLPVGAIEPEDVAVLCKAFPTISALVRRGDLGERNRVLFLLREILTLPSPVGSYTEIALASAWATRGEAEVPPAPHRDQALAQLGCILVRRPDQKPGHADVDPVGFQRLIEEGAVYSHPVRGTIAFTHDVHEDWILARTFMRSIG
jgi:hypothetical protein